MFVPILTGLAALLHLGVGGFAQTFDFVFQAGVEVFQAVKRGGIGFPEAARVGFQ